MFFNEGIALMVIAKPLKYLANDYSLKAYLTYVVIGFLMLILIFRMALEKLTVETILKLRSFYKVYGVILISLSILFVYKNFIAEPSADSVLNGMSKEMVDSYNKQISEQLIKNQMEIKKQNDDLLIECEKNALCSHVKKPSE